MPPDLTTETPRPAAAPKRRAADIAYDAIETLISTLEMRPGSPVVEAEIVERTGLGRTPVREALFAAITEQGARLPSARRFAARARSLERGVAVPRALHAEILRLAGD